MSPDVVLSFGVLRRSYIQYLGRYKCGVPRGDPTYVQLVGWLRERRNGPEFGGKPRFGNRWKAPNTVENPPDSEIGGKPRIRWKP